MPRIVLVALFLATPVFAQTLTVDGANSPLTVSASASYSQVTVATGGTLVVNAPLTVSGPMTVQSGGRVTVDVGVGQLKLNVTGALIVEAGRGTHCFAASQHRRRPPRACASAKAVSTGITASSLFLPQLSSAPRPRAWIPFHTPCG